MINKQAVKKFLARKLANYEWIKEVKHPDLDAELVAMKANKATRTLWQHQKQCLILLHELKRFMLFVDMGGGKTLITLSLMRHCKQEGEKLRAIVFVPFITSVETWIEQVAEHAPDLHIVPLLGTTDQNRYKLSLDGDLFVMCYQSAVAMLGTKRLNKKGKNKLTFEAKDVRAAFADFNMLIMDEVHKCKNVSSLTYRMCRALSAAADYSIGLTGTPFGRDPMDLWPQFYLVDFGETLGPTLGFFRDVFYSTKPGYFGGFDYTFNRKLMPVLNKTVQNCSISYGIDDLMDMPPKRYIKTPLTITDESKGYVDNAVKLLKDAQKDKNLQEIESNYLKLRQLASGFMTLRGDEKERVHIQFADNPKLDALQEIIEGMPNDRKAVIFHHFVYTNQLISDRLKSMKVKHARIYGKSRDPISELRRFKQDVACRALVINSRSGSSSLNLQGANYLVFFEQPDSPIDRQQAERRVWRPGQKWKVLIYDLLMKGTSDVTLHHSNKAGESLLKELLRGKAMA